ncbi:hypothetical protein DERF_013408 [Dermatophagoides farinae]|uniref:Uncharacterized protein n=1 Tax=Dermatophagoides farinae TaxID=6954 RepID=A0A922KV61_DERFA|nr:hypothetical protein DERF_013408 [Dermatophagoides farinae]
MLIPYKDWDNSHLCSPKQQQQQRQRIEKKPQLNYYVEMKITKKKLNSGFRTCICECKLKLMKFETMKNKNDNSPTVTQTTNE